MNCGQFRWLTGVKCAHDDDDVDDDAVDHPTTNEIKTQSD